MHVLPGSRTYCTGRHLPFHELDRLVSLSAGPRDRASRRRAVRRQPRRSRVRHPTRGREARAGAVGPRWYSSDNSHRTALRPRAGRPRCSTELGLEPPMLQLEVGGASARARSSARRRCCSTDAFAANRPEVVVVQGDTNTTVAAALAANARDIPLVHVEAGLRSYDRAMPEEHNRVVTDHLADLCCAPTETSRAQLAAEGITGARVIVTGNTVVDAALAHAAPTTAERAARLDAARPRAGPVRALDLPPARERRRRRDSCSMILAELDALPLPVLLPLHPRTAARLDGRGRGRARRGARHRSDRLLRVPRARPRVRVPRFGLGRGPRGGEHREATGDRRARVDRAARGPRHVRRARSPRRRDRRAGTGLGLGPRGAPRPARRAADARTATVTRASGSPPRSARSKPDPTTRGAQRGG